MPRLGLKKLRERYCTLTTDVDDTGETRVTDRRWSVRPWYPARVKKAAELGNFLLQRRAKGGH